MQELAPLFAGRAPDVTEENLQSRLRGVTLMALSNKTGALVLTTGNKSELAVGYCTLYGDMCGGLAVISDVPKTMVYSLSRIANRRHDGRDSGKRVHQAALGRAAAGSKGHRFAAGIRGAGPDSGSVHRAVPHAAADRGEHAGLPLELVQDIVNKVDRNEYKRQQAAPGLKVTTKAFGIGRRFPIAQRYSE